MKFHSFAAIAVLFFAWYFKFSKLEVLVLVLTITLVLVAEIINTAIEVVVDLISPEYHLLAGLAKDIAAGAVLMTALAALAVAYILFYHKIFS